MSPCIKGIQIFNLKIPMCPTNSDFLKRVYESLDIAFQVIDAANVTYVYMVVAYDS